MPARKLAIASGDPSGPIDVERGEPLHAGLHAAPREALPKADHEALVEASVEVRTLDRLEHHQALYRVIIVRHSAPRNISIIATAMPGSGLPGFAPSAAPR